MKPTNKQIREIKDGEISKCPWCNCMTKSILKGNKIWCLKCEREKE